MTTPSPPDPAATPEDTDRAAQAAQLRAQAAEVRANAQRAVAGAETTLDVAREQAARLVADAERGAHQAATAALAAERRAVELETRASAFVYAGRLEDDIRAADAVSARLVDEAAAVSDEITDRSERLAELDRHRAEIATRTAEARDAGDIDTVAALKAKADAAEDIATATSEALAAARARLRAIGDADVEGIGELPDAMRVAASRRGRLRQHLNEMDPQRPEALLDYALDVARDYTASLMAPEPAPVPRTPVYLPR